MSTSFSGDDDFIAIEIEFTLDTTNQEVSDDQDAQKAGAALEDKLFFQLKNELGDSVHVGVRRGAPYSHGSLLGIIVASALAGSGMFLGAVGVLGSPASVRKFFERSVFEVFGRRVPVLRFAHRVSILRQRGQIAPAAPISVQEPRDARILATSAVLGVFVAAGTAFLYWEQEREWSALNRRLDAIEIQIAHGAGAETVAPEVQVSCPSGQTARSSRPSVCVWRYECWSNTVQAVE